VSGVSRPLRDRALGLLGWVMALTLIAPVVAALFWLASNLSDAPAAARPEALALPAPRLAAERNAAGVLAGLSSGGAKVLPEGAPWYCADAEGCVAGWLAQPAPLAAQRERAALHGRRCEALVDETGFDFEEAFARPPRVDASLVPAHPLGAAFCARWFLSGAAIAQADGAHDEVQRQLQRADRLQRALLAGSHSLIAQGLAQSLAHRLLDGLASMALRDAVTARDAAPLLVPWPSQQAAARRWMVYESNVGRQALADVFEQCHASGSDPSDVYRNDVPAWPERSMRWVSGYLCEHRIGHHPERTLQALDAQWLALLAAVGQGWPAALATLPSPARDDLPLHWRNSFGMAMVEIAHSGWADPVARHADLELHRRLVLLALQAQAQGVAAPERAAWLARQPMAADESGRFSIADAGRTIQARTWRSQNDPARKAQHLRITWPE
jgi:hypothetical protein